MLSILGNLEIIDLLALYSTYLQQKNENRDTKDLTNRQLLDYIFKIADILLLEIKKGDYMFMKAIQIIIDHMNDTLEEAYEYYKDYTIFKDDYPKMASTAVEMAQTHLNLYLKWHEVVVSMINDYKTKSGELPATMKSLYDYEHKKLVEEYDELSYKIKNAKNY